MTAPNQPAAIDPYQPIDALRSCRTTDPAPSRSASMKQPFVATGSRPEVDSHRRPLTGASFAPFRTRSVNWRLRCREQGTWTAEVIQRVDVEELPTRLDGLFQLWVPTGAGQRHIQRILRAEKQTSPRPCQRDHTAFPFMALEMFPERPLVSQDCELCCTLQPDGAGASPRAVKRLLPVTPTMQVWEGRTPMFGLGIKLERMAPPSWPCQPCSSP